MLETDCQESLRSFFFSQADMAESLYQRLAPGGGIRPYDASPLLAARSEAEATRLEDLGLAHHDEVLRQQEDYWVKGAVLAMHRYDDPQATLQGLVEADGPLWALFTRTEEERAGSMMQAGSLPIPEDETGPYIRSIYRRGAAQTGCFVLAGFSWAAALLGRFYGHHDGDFYNDVFTAFSPR